MNEYIRFYPSPVGRLAMVSDGQSLNALLLQKEVEEMKPEETRDNVPAEAERIFRVTGLWLDEYFAGGHCGNPKPAAVMEQGGSPQRIYELEAGNDCIRLCPKGSVFRQEVWKLLCEIPYGETTTYGEIAVQMAGLRGVKKMSAQAVGGAVGHNPISIIIPCHRVVGGDGSLVGYGGGMSVKVQLLKLEEMDMSRFTIPTKGTKL